MSLFTVECNNERYWSTVPILEYTNDALGGGPRNNNCGYIWWVVVAERGPPRAELSGHLQRQNS